MDGGAEPPDARRPARRWQLAGSAVLAALVTVLAVLIVARLDGSSSATRAVAATPPGLDGQATWAPGARPAPAIATLRDQTGHRFVLASLRGHPVAITFWDSHCTQECPLAGRALAAAERTVPRAQRPVLVVVSVNPLDTRASVHAAIRNWGLAGLAPWYWLMGSHASLAPVWRAYRISVVPTKTDIEHTEALYLLDRSGDERSGYLYPYLPARVAFDMRRLAAGVA